MSALAIHIRPQERFGVDLRELHAGLESKQEFAHWAKAKLSQFVEGQDFEVFDNLVKNPTGGRPRIDYTVTVECAKHIAMMEQTDRGREVRQYFIACEEALKEAGVKSHTSTLESAAILARKMERFEIHDAVDLLVFEMMCVLHNRLSGGSPLAAPYLCRLR